MESKDITEIVLDKKTDPKEIPTKDFPNKNIKIKEVKEIKEKQTVKPLKKNSQKGKIIAVRPATVIVSTEDNKGIVLSNKLFLDKKLGDIVEF